MLVDELLMRHRTVSADSHHLRAEAPNPLDIVAKAARLGGASGRHVLGVKVKDEVFLPDEILQRDLVSRRVGHLEMRRLGPFERVPCLSLFREWLVFARRCALLRCHGDSLSSSMSPLQWQHLTDPSYFPPPS